LPGQPPVIIYRNLIGFFKVQLYCNFRPRSTDALRAFSGFRAKIRAYWLTFKSFSPVN
jgi:hypothetical protein